MVMVSFIDIYGECLACGNRTRVRIIIERRALPWLVSSVEQVLQALRIVGRGGAVLNLMMVEQPGQQLRHIIAQASLELFLAFAR